MAVFRAIENRRWVIQAANTGVTEIVTPQGRLRSRLPEAEPGVLIDTLRLRDDATFYLRFGDVFVWLCGAALVGLVAVRRPPRADMTTNSQD
jgi:apolipoprotein N-acyltransferase